MVSRVLILGASGRVGSYVVQALKTNTDGIELRLSTSREALAQKWRSEGSDSVILDLNRPETFAGALEGIDRVFLLTGYTSDMLFQSKKFVDAARDAGVSHLVHLGVFTSRRDDIPHFVWHDLIETYIEASGIAWTHLHPNVITDSVLVTKPSIKETGEFTVFWGDRPQGWVFAEDIGSVAAAVLREGPEKHGSNNYWLSTEVMTGPEVAAILTEAAGKEIHCNTLNASVLEDMLVQISSASDRTYMESAVVTMKLGSAGKMQAQTVVHDDVKTVLGRSGKTISEWARSYFNVEN
ncbi:NmrA family NAD(P)-binding protein [Pectobacterium polaris]|uniref:SDR family oxidoreductase n=1 Tax=Pectobacterium polaris TaxID=2042057 RepID=UPI001CF215D8|nr:NmrA family NAD(P)-binding protein [Pectobacterium polaris]MCA6939913.1 NmrA family NAD(P)-binding protein [Pectobacterium polaris]MCA6955520.1 NmrA family NAD(P)-binding protein [Pectobacterium polaris]